MWFLGFLLQIAVAAFLIRWIVMNPRGFLSVVWRILLVAILAFSLICLGEVLFTFPPPTSWVEYRTPAITAFSFSSMLSGCGLVRSLLGPQFERFSL